MQHLPNFASGFVTLLLLPTLGILGLLRKRAIPVLAWTLAGWGVLGGLALYSHRTFGWGERDFLHGWLLGLGLGSAFLTIAVLHADKRLKPWIRLGLALLTVAAFTRSLLRFLELYT